MLHIVVTTSNKNCPTNSSSQHHRTIRTTHPPSTPPPCVPVASAVDSASGDWTKDGGVCGGLLQFMLNFSEEGASATRNLVEESVPGLSEPDGGPRGGGGPPRRPHQETENGRRYVSRALQYARRRRPHGLGVRMECGIRFVSGVSTRFTLFCCRMMTLNKCDQS